MQLSEDSHSQIQHWQLGISPAFGGKGALQKGFLAGRC